MPASEAHAAYPCNEGICRKYSGYPFILGRHYGYDGRRPYGFWPGRRNTGVLYTDFYKRDLNQKARFKRALLLIVERFALAPRSYDLRCYRDIFRCRYLKVRIKPLRKINIKAIDGGKCSVICCRDAVVSCLHVACLDILELEALRCEDLIELGSIRRGCYLDFA